MAEVPSRESLNGYPPALRCSEQLPSASMAAPDPVADRLATATLVARTAAFGLDYVLIAAYLVVVVGAGVLLRLVAPGESRALFSDPLWGELTGFLGLTLPVTSYFALSERSAAGATWGKRRMRLRVVASGGRRLGLGRSLLRSGLKFLPWELAHAVIWQFSAAGPNPPWVLNAGLVGVWLLVGSNLLSARVDRRRRTLYDRAAGTVVIRLS